MRVVLACVVFALAVQSTLLAFQRPITLSEKISSTPKLGDSKVNPQDGLRYLSVTQRGRAMCASLYANVFMMEHEQGRPPGH